MQTLEAQGFDTRYVGVLDGKTSYGEIFVDPEGERTIMANGGRARTFMPSISGVKADAAYINTVFTSTELNEAAAATALMVSQYPLHPIAPRPADVVIASRADLHGQEMDQFWQNVQGFAGERLASIVVTDGPRHVSAFDGKAETQVTPARSLASIDTTGAGDYFAGGYMDGILRGMS